MKAVIGCNQKASQRLELAPVLQQGDIVVTDNLASHKVKGVRQAIEQGATDLNPIEQVFAKLKAALRKATARTFDTLVEAIADALDTFTRNAKITP